MNPTVYFVLALTIVLATNTYGAVLDIDGDIIFRGSYYVLPVIRGRGGGLTLRGRDLNIKTDVEATICFQSTYWRVGEFDEERQQYVVVAGLQDDSPNSFFQIEKSGDDAYKFVFCPKTGDSGRQCTNVGIFVDEIGVRRLALSSEPFLVMFKKANVTEISSKTILDQFSSGDYAFTDRIRDWAKHRIYLKAQNPPPPLASFLLSPSCHSFLLIFFLLLIPFDARRTLQIENKMNREKLMKMANTVRTGGKGTVRRKKKAVHKTNTTDDKKLQSTLKRVGVNSIPGIEEVNIFKDDVVIQFINPKVQASVAANTWAVSGAPQTKKLQDILPQIISQLGTDNLDNLKKLAEQFQKQAPGGGADVPATIQEEDEDDVPELVAGETFETPAAQEAAKATA
ncbi:unnamed protein product [Brassica rapa subsp. trilocularis]